MTTPAVTEPLPQPPIWRPGFNEYLLAAIAALVAVATLIGFVLYLLPPEPLALSELQPAYRVVGEAEFPVGASRVVNWGANIILVIRTGEQAYAALQATSPTDGCILRWDATSQRVLSPCTYLVYDLHGNVVRGLTTVPLHRYAVFVRDDVVYVTRA